MAKMQLCPGISITEFLLHIYFSASARASSWSKEPPSSSSKVAARKDQRPRPTTNMQVGTESRKNTQSFVSFLFYPCSLHKQDPRQKQMCICQVFSPCLWVSFVFSLKHHIIRSDPKSPAVQCQAYIDCFIQEHSEGTTPP